MAYTIAFFGTKPYDEASFNEKNKEYDFELRYYKGHLNKHNVILTQGVDAVCIFVNDTADAEVLRMMADNGVKLLAPSINYSTDRFKVEDGNIRYSLLAIKNVGYAGYKAIEAERQNGTFKDIFDFVSRMESSKLNRKMLDSLIMAGAFDEFKLNRTTIKQNLHKIMEYAELKNSIGIDEPPILTIVRDNRIKVLEEEKMVLGVYLTMHPIALIKNNLKEQIVNLNELSNYIDQPVRVIMALSRVKVIVDKKGQEMCFVDGYDETGEVDAVVFASSFQVLKKILVRGEICLIEGRVNYRDKLSLIINQAKNVR